jgi:mRNA interferase MazF
MGMVKKIHQYEICLINLDPSVGSEMKKTRPCIILSPDEMNANLKHVIIAPMTKTIRKYPTRVNIKFKSQDGEIALEHIKSLDKLRIVKKIGELEKKTIKEIKKKLQEIFID